LLGEEYTRVHVGVPAHYIRANAAQVPVACCTMRALQMHAAVPLLRRRRSPRVNQFACAHARACVRACACVHAHVRARVRVRGWRAGGGEAVTDPTGCGLRF
jgi:hypothetical protein